VAGKKKADAQPTMKQRACASALLKIRDCFALLNHRPTTAQQVDYQNYRSDDQQQMNQSAANAAD
jgi:hypothetical protein